eukprot:g26447.t1
MFIIAAVLTIGLLIGHFKVADSETAGGTLATSSQPAKLLRRRTVLGLEHIGVLKGEEYHTQQQETLQTSLPSDVSAAQRDIRHLCLEHLLTIRDDAADFKTHSQSHEAHNSFLNMIDQRLRELCCSKFMDPKQLDEVPAEDKQRLGHIVLLVQGAAAVLAGQEPEAASFAVSSGRVPRQWLLRSPIAPWRACWLRLPSEDETDTLERLGND